MYTNIDTEIKELKSNLLKVYADWKKNTTLINIPKILTTLWFSIQTENMTRH